MEGSIMNKKDPLRVWMDANELSEDLQRTIMREEYEVTLDGLKAATEGELRYELNY